jgi:hypothetical protein
MRSWWYEATVALACAAGILWCGAGLGYTPDPPDLKDKQPPSFHEAVLKTTKPIFDG